MYTLDGIYEVNKTLSWKNLDNVAFRRADKLARTSSQLTDEVEMARIRCFLAENSDRVMSHCTFQSIMGYGRPQSAFTSHQAEFERKGRTLEYPLLRA